MANPDYDYTEVVITPHNTLITAGGEVAAIYSSPEGITVVTTDQWQELYPWHRVWSCKGRL